MSSRRLRGFALVSLACMVAASVAVAAPTEKSGTNKAGTNKAGANKASTNKAGTNKSAASPDQGVNEANAAANKVSEGGIFTAAERDRMTDYYRKNRTLVPNTKPLPPGIAKNLQRGKPLPPGIAKTRLPNGLESTLPARKGYTRYQVGPDVVMVDKSGKVQDIMREVFKD